MIPGPGGALLLPSAVAADQAGRILVGAAAAARIARLPGCGARFFKRDLGTDRTWTFGGRTWTAIELSAVILKEARAWAEAALATPVRRAVITVPAYFQEPQRAATAEAATLAGLEVVRMVNEPTAAAIAHGVVDPERERRVAVLDLGGGTFDVTLLDIFDGVIEVVGTGGDGRLGGEDFTDALWAWACRRAGLPAPGDQPGPLQALLREACDEVRKELSARDLVRLGLPDPAHESWTPLRTEVLTRPAFAQIVQPLLERVGSCVRDTLRAAGRTARDIDEVVLAGGATRMPVVREVMAGILGRAPVEGPDPDLAIALGAALQGGLVTRHAALREVVVTDVLAHSLGVEVSRQADDRWLDGYFLPILHRNTTLPARRVERLWTMSPRQTEVRLRVYAGEHRYVRENRLLGAFAVKDLPPDPEGGNRGVDVSFAHDLNGLLEVEATPVGAGKPVAVVIEQQAGRLTPAERAKALVALAKLKVLPRDLLPNRLILEEALTRHARLRAEQRQLLDGPLLRFEAALEGQDPAVIAAAAAALREALAHPLLRPEEP